MPGPVPEWRISLSTSMMQADWKPGPQAAAFEVHRYTSFMGNAGRWVFLSAPTVLSPRGDSQLRKVSLFGTVRRSSEPKRCWPREPGAKGVNPLGSRYKSWDTRYVHKLFPGIY